MALTKVHTRMIDGDAVSVTDFGATGNGTTDDTAAIQAAIDAVNTAGGGTVFFPKGNYKTDSQITLVSNLTILAETGAIIKPSDTVPAYACYGTGLDNISVEGLTIEGTGTAYSSGTQGRFQLDSSTNITIRNCTFKKSRNTGMVFDAVSNLKILGCTMSNNYIYGVEVRNESSDIIISNCVCDGNGSTGVATSAFGRGVVLWKVLNAIVANTVFKSSTEYGLRLYSDAADTAGTENVAISNCTFDSNDSIDFYIYNASDDIKYVSVSNCTFKTKSGAVSIALAGDYVTVTGCTMLSQSAQGATAFTLYNVTNASITGCVLKDYSTAFSYSGTNIPAYVTIANCQVMDVAIFTNGVYGEGHAIKDCYIKHGGTGTTDLCFFLDKAGSTGTKVTNNVIDGFYRVAQLNTSVAAVEFVGNTCKNTTDLTIRMYGTDLRADAGFVLRDNTFDLGTNPTELGKIQIDGHVNSKVLGYDNVVPSQLTYEQGDTFFNIAPTAGGTVGWVCVTAGTPGTWKTFGTISA
jgi:parallel beta-helix repeat protein